MKQQCGITGTVMVLQKADLWVVMQAHMHIAETHARAVLRASIRAAPARLHVYGAQLARPRRKQVSTSLVCSTLCTLGRVRPYCTYIYERCTHETTAPARNRKKERARKKERERSSKLVTVGVTITSLLPLPDTHHTRPGSAMAGATSSSTCAPCTAGTYSAPGTSKTMCSSCPVGKYSNVTGATTESTCLACHASSDAPAGSDDASDCICNAGFTSEGNRGCAACAAGTYKGGSGNEACTDCGAGKYSTASGATAESTCSACGAGKYSTASGATAESTCSACHANSEAPAGSDDTSDCICNAGLMMIVLFIVLARNKLRISLLFLPETNFV